jgi:hypothetical protein
MTRQRPWIIIPLYTAEEVLLKTLLHTPSVGCLASSALSLLLYVLLQVLFASIEGGSYVSCITDRTQKCFTSPSDPFRCCDRGTTAYPACFTYPGLDSPLDDTCRANPCQEHISTENGPRLTGHWHADRSGSRVGGAVRAWMGEYHLG